MAGERGHFTGGSPSSDLTNRGEKADKHQTLVGWELALFVVTIPCERQGQDGMVLVVPA